MKSKAQHVGWRFRRKGWRFWAFLGSPHEPTGEYEEKEKLYVITDPQVIEELFAQDQEAEDDPRSYD